MSSFCSAKATHIFSAKNIRILYIESAKIVNEMTLNKLVKLTTLSTSGPRMVKIDELLRKLETLGRLSDILTREITSVTVCLFSCTSSPYLKGVYSEMKEIAPRVESSFFLVLPHFKKETKRILTEPFLCFHPLS